MAHLGAFVLYRTKEYFSLHCLGTPPRLVLDPCDYRTPCESPRFMTLQDDNPVLKQIKRLRDEFESKYHRPMTHDEVRILELTENYSEPVP